MAKAKVGGKSKGAWFQELNDGKQSAEALLAKLRARAGKEKNGQGQGYDPESISLEYVQGKLEGKATKTSKGNKGGNKKSGVEIDWKKLFFAAAGDEANARKLIAEELTADAITRAEAEAEKLVKEGRSDIP